MSHSTFNLSDLAKLLKENPRSTKKLYNLNKESIDKLYPNIEDWNEKIYLVKEELNNPPLCLCGKFKQFHRFSNGYFETCGNSICKTKQRIIKQEQTNLKKFGYKNATQSPEVKKKIKETNLSKYGVTCTLNEKQTKEKIKNTLRNKYGVDSPLQSNVLQEKRNNTMIKKYGTNSVFYSDIYKESMLKKYNVINPMQSSDILKRVSDTQRKQKLDILVEKIKSTNKEFISVEENRLNLKCKKCGNIFSIHRCSLNAHLRNDNEFCQKCNPINRFRSNGKNEVYEFCLNEFSNQKISNNRKIGGYELDIFFDDLNFGIEYNGLYWHSEDYKSEDYHQKKLEKFESLGINILQIWEDDWFLKQDIIKNIIRSKINPIKIGARNFKIKIVDFKEAKEFHEKFHLDGYSVAKIHIGLYLEGELISLASFGKSRYKNDAEWELIRYTTKENYSIIGGFSKILNFFVKNQNPLSLKSYKKLDLGYKNFYESLGFKKEKRVSPNFFWIVNGVRVNRQNFQKKKLKNIKDGQTAIEYMHEQGYKRLWDSGSDLFIKIF